MSLIINTTDGNKEISDKIFDSMQTLDNYPKSGRVHVELHRLAVQSVPHLEDKREYNVGKGRFKSSIIVGSISNEKNSAYIMVTSNNYVLDTGIMVDIEKGVRKEYNFRRIEPNGILACSIKVQNLYDSVKTLYEKKAGINVPILNRLVRRWYNSGLE